MRGYIEDWDWSVWAQEHGTWASAEWDDERRERDEAAEVLADALRAAADAVVAGEPPDWDDVAEAREAYDAALSALDGAVEPDESDYLAEGTIDPDGVSDDPGVEAWSQTWDGWDCREGEQLYLAVVPEGGLRIVHRWWRVGWGQRRSRDWWRVVDVISDADEIRAALDEACLTTAERETLARALADADAA